MGEILGNNSLYKNSLYLNLYSDSQIDALQEKIKIAQASVTLWTEKYEEAKGYYDHCKSQGALYRCRYHTGKSQSTWKSYRDSRLTHLNSEKRILANAQKAYNDALAANRAEESMKITEHQADVAGQAELQGRGKTIGLWAVIILGVGFGSLFVYKKFIKK